MDTFETEIVALLPRLRRFGRSITRTVDDADDLVQIAVERALARRRQWRVGTRLDAWLFTIMKNAWIDQTRARGRRGQVVESDAGTGVWQVADRSQPSADSHLTARAAEQALASLPEDQRIAVALVLVEGLSYAEAAAVLHIPQGTLTSRLVRGRAALGARLLEEANP